MKLLKGMLQYNPKMRMDCNQVIKAVEDLLDIKNKVKIIKLGEKYRMMHRYL